MKSNPSPWPICLMMTAIALVGVFCSFAHGQTPTPNLVVSAGSTGQAPSLTITSDSTAPWKCFTVSGGSGAYNVIWAESNLTTGGIYFGSILTSSTGPGAVPTPPAPAPTDLPIGTLTSAVSAAVAGVDQATAVKMGDTYEALAKSVDSGVIVSPLQLQLATGTQLLAQFNSEELGSLAKLTAAINGWVDAQQCSGKLTPERMDKYSRSYHAIASAIRPAKEPATSKRGQSPATGDSPADNKTGNSTPAAKVDCTNTAPMVYERDQLPGKSPCPDGHCKLPAQFEPRWRRR